MIAKDIAVRATESVTREFGEDLIGAPLDTIAHALIDFISNEAGESGYRLSADEARRWAANLQSEARDDVRQASARLGRVEQDESRHLFRDADD